MLRPGGGLDSCSGGGLGLVRGCGDGEVAGVTGTSVGCGVGVGRVGTGPGTAAARLTASAVTQSRNGVRAASSMHTSYAHVCRSTEFNVESRSRSSARSECV